MKKIIILDIGIVILLIFSSCANNDKSSMSSTTKQIKTEIATTTTTVSSPLVCQWKAFRQITTWHKANGESGKDEEKIEGEFRYKFYKDKTYECIAIANDGSTNIHEKGIYAYMQSSNELILKLEEPKTDDLQHYYTVSLDDHILKLTFDGDISVLFSKEK